MAPNTLTLNCLLEPNSVAIVGASSDPGKTPGRPVDFLKRHRFAGEILPINPNRSEIQGLACYPSLRDLPQRPDQAFIALDTDGAIAAAEEAADLGVPFVVMLANGFSEVGAEGVAREDRLRDILEGSSTRLLGPNSLGLVRPLNGLFLTANAAFAVDDIPTGRTAVISQSGSAIGGFVSRGRARGIGYSVVASVGNEVDLSVGSLGEVIVQDEHTDTIILFLESIRRAKDLERLAVAARAAEKEILVYKLGRSDVGAGLAVSHTGAIVTSDAAADAYLKDLGFHRMETFEAVFEGAALFSKTFSSSPRQHPVAAVVSTTGGGGALVADRLGVNGVRLRGATVGVKEKIKACGIEVGGGALIDLTLAGTKPDVMRAAIGAVLDDDAYDALIAVIGSSSEHFPKLAVQPIVEIVEERRNTGLKPLAVFCLPQATKALELLQQVGVAAFRTPESCADAMTERLRPAKANPNRLIDFVSPSSATKDLFTVLPDRVTEGEALDFFETMGVPVTARAFLSAVETRSGAGDLSSLTYPVVAKVASPDLAHKSEYGGVVLNLGDEDEARTAANAILETVAERAPKAQIDGVLFQHQAKAVQEVILGLTRHAEMGPLVTIGVGGVLAEIYADAVTQRAPVTPREARDMIDAVKGLAIARGYRGGPQGDLDALADAISAFSQLGVFPEIREAEINPIMVTENGVVAVDGLMSIRRNRGDDDVHRDA